MHASLDFVTKLLRYTSFFNSWSTSEERKNLDAVLLEPFLAANADAVAYQMEEYNNSGLVVISHCLNSLWHNNCVASSLLYVLLRESHNINAVCHFFPHFIMAVIPHVKCDVGSGRENGTVIFLKIKLEK